MREGTYLIQRASSMFGKEHEWRERTSAKSQAGDEKVAFSHPTKNHPDSVNFSILPRDSMCKILCFCCSAVEIFTLLGCCILLVGSLLPVFEDNTRWFKYDRDKL
jgi:cytochrome c biogenesis protein CcdA